MQQERIVIAEKASVNPVAFSSKPTSGVQMEKSGFAIIQRHETTAINMNGSRQHPRMLIVNIG